MKTLIALILYPIVLLIKTLIDLLKFLYQFTDDVVEFVKAHKIAIAVIIAFYLFFYLFNLA
jgi:hypothetical protein